MHDAACLRFSSVFDPRMLGLLPTRPPSVRVMRAPADLDGDEASPKEVKVASKKVCSETTTGVPASSKNPCPAADGVFGRHSTAFIVGLVAVCFLAVTGTVMYVNGVEDTVTAAAGTWQGLTVRLQEHFSEEVETRNTRRQLLQTGLFIADASNASAAAAVPVDTCSAITGQVPTWGNPAMQLKGTCTTYRNTMSGSSYSSTARLDWTVCWGANVTAVRTFRAGRQALRFVGRMSPWAQGGWYPVDVLQYGTRRTNDTRPQLIDCPQNVVSKLSPVCGCEQSLAVSADTASDPSASNTTDCKSPDLLVTDPAFCVF